MSNLCSGGNVNLSAPLKAPPVSLIGPHAEAARQILEKLVSQSEEKRQYIKQLTSDHLAQSAKIERMAQDNMRQTEEIRRLSGELAKANMRASRANNQKV